MFSMFLLHFRFQSNPIHSFKIFSEQSNIEYCCLSRKFMGMYNNVPRYPFKDFEIRSAHVFLAALMAL